MLYLRPGEKKQHTGSREVFQGKIFEKELSLQNEDLIIGQLKIVRRSKNFPFFLKNWNKLS